MPQNSFDQSYRNKNSNPMNKWAFLFFGFLLFCGQAQAQKAKSPPPVKAPPAQAAAADETLKAIDNAFAELNPEKALGLTKSALAAQPNNPEIMWRHSRALVGSGDRLKNKEAQLASYEEAKAIAEKVVNAQPKSMYGYLRRAVACGKIALFKGVLETRELVLQTKKDAEQAISLNNASPYELALGHYLLGRVHLKLSETPKVMRMPLQLAWGNLQEAESNLSKAVSTFPDSPGFRVDYAKALIKLEKKNEAKAELQKAIAAKPLDASDVERIAEAKDLLKTI